MSKFVGLAVAAVSLVMAIACGSSDDPAPVAATAGSYKGTVDYSVIGGNAENIYVLAKSGSAELSRSMLTVPAGYNATSGIDYEYTLSSNLYVGNTYTFDVVKLDSAGNTFELLSTVDKVTSTSGVLSKPNPAYKNARQINLYTTLVATQVKKGKDLKSATQAVFGDAVTDLSQIVVTNGSVSAGAAVVTIPSVVTQMATMLSTTVVAAASMTPADLLSSAAKLAETAAALASIDLVGSKSDLNDLTKVSLSAVYASVSSAVASLGSAIQDLVAAAIANVNSASTLTLADLKDATALGTKVAADVKALNDAVVVKSFDLADSTYGAKTTTGFVLNSLAPVFKVVVSGNYSDNVVSSLLDMSVKGTATTLDFTSASSSFTTTSKYDATADTTAFYLYVNYPSSNSLMAGGSYSYTLKSKDIKFKFQGGFSTSGTIIVRAATFTYANSSMNSPVEIDGMGGVSAGDVMFYLNSSEAIAIDSSKALYGILGADSALSLTVSGGSAVTPSISGIVSGATSTKSAVVTLPSVAKGSYTVTVAKDKGLMTAAGKEVTDYPTTLKLTVK